MADLFSETDVDNKPLIEYVSWFLDSKNSDYDIVQLPPIQRNAVWNSSQIERLWDSILRGFPIGSFLLSPRKKGSTARRINSSEQTETEKDGYFLLDGQQRTRSILLGFKPNDDTRLWIDLNPQLSFDNSEFNDRQFLFRFISKYQPWGMNDRNPDDKLSENEKFKARAEVYKDFVRYRYDYKVDIKDTWPAKAKLPIPFDTLINMCGGYSGNFIEPQWNEVLEFVPERFKMELRASPTEHFKLLTEALIKLLDKSNSNGKIRALAFLNQGELTNITYDSANSQDPIEVLFRRINSGGKVLEGEEMAYSILKSSWDEAYVLVSQIVKDIDIGYLFSSTGFVMAATRMARFNLNKSGDSNPNVADFRKWIGEKNESNTISFLDEMKNLMKTDNGKSKFHSVLERFCKLVLYRGKGDIGLPRKLLLSIKSLMYHPILIWLYKTDLAMDERNRQAILRYLIFSFIGVYDHKKALKKALEVIKVIVDSDFPDYAIYKKWVDDKDDKSANRIPNVEKFKTTLSVEANGILRNWEDVMGTEDDIYRNLRNGFWNKKELLLWFQREYNSKWFDGYNPMSNDAYDTPYDYDHILPYSHLIYSGGVPNTCIIGNEHEAFLSRRHLYVNSIGNFRIWPSWANRSDNNKCHTHKMRMNIDVMEIDAVAKELTFESNKDFIKASIINVEDFDLWMKAGGNPRDWNESRRIAWQRAVENRVIYLYQDFYSSFGFSEWESKEL